MKLLRLVLLIALSVVITPAFASHYSAASLSYRCVGSGSDSLEVRLILSYDCSANIGILDSVPINIDGCGSSFTSMVYKDSSSHVFDWGRVQANHDGAYESSQLCASDIAQSRCAVTGNGFPGSQEVVFKGLVVLPSQCASWTIYHDVICCRNTSGNLPNSVISTVATIDNANFLCNNSPVFGSRPTPYFLTGSGTFNPGVREEDGDSLVYSFDCGYAGFPTQNNFETPFSCSSPLMQTSIDAHTGQVEFTQMNTGNYFMIIKVDEYDRTSGMLKGSALRDFMVTFQTSPNTNPSTSPVTNLGASTTQLSPRELQVSSGNQLEFDYTFVDADSADSLSIISNIHRVLPGAQVAVTHPVPSRYDSAVASIQWTATNIPGNWTSFYLAGNDNKCPILGLTYQDFRLHVIPSNVSTEQVLGLLEVQIFPNPTADELKVVSETSIGEMVIYNMEGRKLLEAHTAGTKHSFQLEGLAAGTYFLLVKNSDGQSRHRFIKN